MLYALIDNATLTAVQRVMGNVPIKTPDSISGDLAALESLVQAILFYDNLLCLDTYKAEYRKKRESEFSYINFLNVNDVGLSNVESLAKDEVKAINPRIHGGKFVDDDFQHLLKLLKMNVICTWDLQSSVYYLTMKMLGQPDSEEYQKYSELSTAIFNEMSEVNETKGHWSEEVQLFGSDGRLHTIEEMMEESKSRRRGKGGTTRALDIFIASLNWLAYKSIYYSFSANILKADTFLHPIRHGFQIHWMQKRQAYGHDFTSKLVKALQSQILSSVSEIVDVGRTHTISLDLPVFSAWLTSKTGNVKEVIDAAFELRKSQEIQDVSGLLRDIRIAYDREDLKEANRFTKRWNRKLCKASEAVKRVYGVDTGQGIQVSPFIKVYNSFASLQGWPAIPAIDYKVKLPNSMRINQSSGFGNVYKDIAKELTAFDRLGSIRDLMSEHFYINKEEYYPPPKTELPKFRRVNSDWKIPM